MSFSEKTVSRINGWGAIFRFVTPMMVGILLAQYNFGYQEQAKFREDIRRSILELSKVLNAHLQHDVPLMRERLSTVESRLDIQMPKRRLP